LTLAYNKTDFDLGERVGGKNMANLKFAKEITALLVIDPYNDFISEGGKLWDRIKTVAEANDCLPHMLQVLNAARNAELFVFCASRGRRRKRQGRNDDVLAWYPRDGAHVHVARDWLGVTSHIIELKHEYT